MKITKVFKLIVPIAIGMGFISSSHGQGDQRNLGAGCGCPAVNTRPTVNLSTLGVTTANGIIEFTGDVHLDCTKLYHIDSISGFGAKFYVPSGKTLTVDPG